MKILIGVSNFARIKKAEIDISNFAVFVGKNNSGKSYMMQLIYGLMQRLPKLDILVDDYEIKENTELELERETDWFFHYESKVNTYLKENKENIVESIFRRSVPVEDIYIKIIDINEKIKIRFNGRQGLETKKNYGSDANVCPKKNNRIQLYIEEQNSKTGEILYSSKVSFSINQSREFIKLYVEREVTGLIWNLFMGRKELIFLPASKMGIQLLDKDLFNEIEDKKQAGKTARNKQRLQKAQEMKSKLSLPVHDFAQFLSNYTPNNKMIKDNKKLTDFIENYLIDGRLKQEGENMVFIQEDAEQGILLSLSSSIVNELAPIIKALTGTVDYQYFFCDSIENCLDLKKQREMARLLMRLNNSGKRLIVSTYSETMLSEINQLLQLSSMEYTEEKNKKKLDKLNLTEEDLLKSENIHIYRFSNRRGGMSTVSELKF